MATALISFSKAILEISWTRHKVFVPCPIHSILLDLLFYLVKPSAFPIAAGVKLTPTKNTGEVYFLSKYFSRFAIEVIFQMVYFASEGWSIPCSPIVIPRSEKTE